MKKNLYHVKANRTVGYDQYDEAVICAFSEDEAMRMSPVEGDQSIALIGEAKSTVEFGIVCASFNAG